MKDIKYTPIYKGKFADVLEEEVRKIKADRYIAQAKRKRRIETIKGYMALAFIIVAVGLVGKMDCESEIKADAKEVAAEQRYIVRYGITEDYGSIILTEDGNEWTLINAPEYEDGTEVRVLFDSNETESVLDDIIMDVTER